MNKPELFPVVTACARNALVNLNDNVNERLTNSIRIFACQWYQFRKELLKKICLPQCDNMSLYFAGPTPHKSVHTQRSERPHAHQSLIMDMAAPKGNGLFPFLIFAPQATCTEQGHTGSQSLPRNLLDNFTKSITHRADIRFADCFDLFFREIPAKTLQ